MSLGDKQLYLCSCNRTMPLDEGAVCAALGVATPGLHQQLCQREAGAFADGARGDVVVACTQEARLFGELAEGNKRVATVRFVNIRETGGWSAQAPFATPKIAALLAAAALPEPEAPPRVTYSSGGQLLVVGPLDAALGWADRLKDQLAVTVLATHSPSVELPAERRYDVFTGRVKGLRGWLGAFEVEWEQDNPIDLDVCTRCNACVRACPEQAIGFDYQVDLERCRSHRACVAACGAVGAIDFERRDRARSDRFDLVLDLSAEPLLRMTQPPQGYFAPGRDALAQAMAVAELAQMVGEFEKPRYFAYKAGLCAHSRSQKKGCDLCIDVCSTAAIAPDGDHVRVEPSLCMGCGGCATVCPSGAMTYAYPRAPDLGVRMRTMLSTYAKAGGRDATLLVHDAGRGAAAVAALARHGRGLPARVIPFDVHHVASLGMDVWLAAIAYGACEVLVLDHDGVVPEYKVALSRQMGFAGTIVAALGYQGEHFALLPGEDWRTLEHALWSRDAALGVRVPATFALAPEKRTTLDLALEHLLAHAPTPRTEIPLAAGAPFGSLRVNALTCTMCLACVGACPEGALADNPERPQLRFVERKCVQCGLCATTCPESAITLEPRLWLAPESKQLRVLNEAEIAACTRCGKPLGTAKMVEGMLARLTGHSMFATPEALARLRMCADCRVIDLMEHEKGVSVFDVRKGP